MEHRRRTYIPAKGGGRPFKKDEFLPLVKKLVPSSAFHWERRDRIDHERLADFVSVKLQDAFFQGKGEYFARASRDATLANMRSLRAKGILNWTMVSHQYTRLLQIAVEYRLLEVVEEHVPPQRDSAGNRLGRGTARVIGPGAALPDLRAEFQKLYEAWRATRPSSEA